MRILITANAAWYIWNFRRAIIETMIADGHEVTILAPPDSSVTDITSIGCRFLPLHMNNKGLNAAQEIGLFFKLRKIFQKENPDIIFSNTIKNNIFGAVAARGLHIPFVPNVTGLGTAFLAGRPLQFVAETLYRYAFRKVPTVFFQNEDDQQLFLDRKLVRATQARLLPGSGIDLVRFAAADYPKSGDAPVFLMIGRLLRDKGVVEYVEAARQIRRELPEARFRLLGEAGSQNRTAIDRETVAGWEKQGLIEYLGTTPDVRPFIAEANCVVLPSYREGAPRTLIEAAAMARPLIATDVPGCRAVVDEGTTGLLCAVKNADSLAAAFRRFLALPQASKRAMGLAGRAKMEKEYDERIVIAAYRKVISELSKDK